MEMHPRESHSHSRHGIAINRDHAHGPFLAEQQPKTVYSLTPYGRAALIPCEIRKKGCPMAPLIMSLIRFNLRELFAVRLVRTVDELCVQLVGPRGMRVLPAVHHPL